MTILAHRRHDISERVWKRMEPHLPGRRGSRGGVERNSRRLADTVFWIVRIGAPPPGAISSPRLQRQENSSYNDFFILIEIKNYF